MSVGTRIEGRFLDYRSDLKTRSTLPRMIDLKIFARIGAMIEDIELNG